MHSTRNYPVVDRVVTAAVPHICLEEFDSKRNRGLILFTVLQSLVSPLITRAVRPSLHPSWMDFLPFHITQTQVEYCDEEQQVARRSQGRPDVPPRYCKPTRGIPWRQCGLWHHLHETASAEGVSLSVTVLIHRASVGTTTAQRGQPLGFSYDHPWLRCIRREEGCYLSKAKAQRMKNCTCATKWSVLCPPPHRTAAPCYESPRQSFWLRESRLCPIHHCVLYGFFSSSFSTHLLVDDYIISVVQTTSLHIHLSRRWTSSIQRHTPCSSPATASPPPVTMGLRQKAFAFTLMRNRATC